MSTSRTAPSPGPRGSLPASRSWRREAAFGTVRARWFATRVLLLIAVLALLGYFVFALRRPFEHARPVLILMGEPVAGEAIPEHSRIDVPFAGFVRRDFEAFAPLAPVTGQDDEDVPVRLTAPPNNDDLGRLRRELARTEGPGSVAILYVSGSGVSIDGQPLLYWNRLDDGLPTQTDIGLLLDVVSSSPARSKLLLLDAGAVRTLPARGMLVNGFVQLLEDEVEERNDPSLWVLVSHSMLEVSHICYSEERSIFGSSVVEGLAGAADANDDRAVDLAELYEFTARTVGRRVDDLTLGLESQSPRLLWSGGSLHDAHPPVLVPVLENGTAAGSSKTGSSKTGTSETETTDSGSGGSGNGGSGNGDGSASDASTGGGAKSGEAAAKSSAGDSSTSQGSSTATAGSKTKTPTDAASPAPATGATATGAASGAAAPKATTEAPASGSKASNPPAASPTAVPAAPAAGTSPSGGSTATANPGSPSPLSSPSGGSVGSDVATSPAGTKEIARSLKKLDPTARKLHDTWALRDRLLQRKGPMWRTAADTEPGAWRGLENTLALYEWRIRRKQDSASAMQAALERLADEFRELDRRSRRLERVVTPGTLGMVQLWTKPDDPLRTVLAPFDAAVRSPNDASLQKLLAKLPPGASSLAELRLARSLLATSAPWQDVRRVLRDRRRFGIAVASAGTYAEWIEGDARWIDERLSSVERTLLDRVDPARDRPVVERLLREARQRLAIVESTVVVLHRAEQVRDDSALRMGDDIDWTFRVAAAVPDEDRWHGRPREMVTGIQRLNALMQTPRSDLVDDVARATAHLAGLRREIESTLTPAYVVALVESGRGVAPGFLEALLSNPACRADVRLLAIEALRDVEEDGRARGHARHLAWTARLRPMLLASRWEPYVRLAEDELASRRLERVLAGIDKEEKAMVRADRERIEQLQSGVESNVVDDAHRNRVRRVFRQLGREIGRYHQARPSGLPVWAAFRALSSPQSNAASTIWRDDLAATLRLRASLLASNLQGADAAESSVIGDQIESIDRALRGVGSDRPNSVRSTRLRARTSVAFRTTELDERESQAVVTVRLDWHGGDAEPAWILVDAGAGTRVLSDSAVRIETPTSIAAAPADHVAVRTDLRSRPPSMQLRSDGPTNVPLVLVSNGPVPPRGRLVVHVVTRAGALRIPITLPESNAPPIALQGAGIDRSLAFDDDGDASVLYPFPNRSTAYQLLAASTDDRARTVAAALYAPRTGPLPTRRIATSPDNARALLDRLGLSVPFAVQPKLAIPADGKAVRIQWTAAPAATSAAPTGKADAKPPTPVGRQLLLVLRDSGDGRVEIVPIRVAPQHPRRYTRPRAEYDAASRTARIVVEVSEPASRPNGAIPLRARVLDLQGSDGAARRPIVVESTLRAGETRAKMSIPVPPEFRGGALLSVAVDGWPRAFVFRIDPARSDATLPEVRGALRARIVDPPDGKAFPGSVRTIPVALQADLPELTGPNAAGRVLVGLDLNGDRELVGEPQITVTTDRLVSPTATITDDGRLSLAVKVTDLVLPVPVPPSTNARVGLLARVETEAESVWGREVPVVVDGEPPRVLAFDLATRSPIVIGAPATAIANVTDDGLSGVAKVEVAIDAGGTGEFPKKGPVLNGVRDPQGAWRVAIPTKTLAPGPHSFLVRATDAVGNVSETRRLTFSAITQADREKVLAETTRIVRGRVTYLGDPVPEASVVLRSAVAKPTDDSKPLEVTTKADGTFEFPEVKPGSVQVTAEAVVRDRRRKDAKTVQVPTIPEDPPFVELDLPYARKP